MLNFETAEIDLILAFLFRTSNEAKACPHWTSGRIVASLACAGYENNDFHFEPSNCSAKSAYWDRDLHAWAVLAVGAEPHPIAADWP